MKPLTMVKSYWESYAAHLLEGIAEESAQYIETRRGFYAGALAMMDCLTTVGKKSTTQEAGLVILEMIKQELKQFALDIEEGRA